MGLFWGDGLGETRACHPRESGEPMAVERPSPTSSPICAALVGDDSLLGLEYVSKGVASAAVNIK